jgi:hypothetical protein
MAKSVHPHPQYVTTQGYYDIGIVILEDSILDVPLLPINRETPTASMLSDVSIVGYGKTHDRDSTFAVTKYRADGLSATLDPTHTITVGDDVRHACVGDSGGPVLAEIDGVPTIIGTDSYSDETGDATRCRMPSHYQRVDTYLAFIDQYVPPGIAGGGGEDAGLDGATGSDGIAGDAGEEPTWTSDAGAEPDAGGMDDADGTDPAGSDGGTDATGGGTNMGDGGATRGPTGWPQNQAQANGGCTVATPLSKPALPGLLGFAALVTCLAWRSGSPSAVRSRKF